MKLIKTLFKKIEQKNKLDLITELLIVGNSTEEAFRLFERVKANFDMEISKRELQAQKDINLIRGASQGKAYDSNFNQMVGRGRRTYDSNFDKPLSEIETNFEIVEK